MPSRKSGGAGGGKKPPAKKSPARARHLRAVEASELTGPPPQAKCKAKTAKGKPCRGRPVAGTDLCPAHLGINGRKSTLTEEITDRICSVLRAGGYVQAAAAAAGVPVRTYNHWLERGDPNGTKSADEPYRAFREKVELAIGEGESINVARIATASAKDWKAAAWLLERRHPERWAGPRGRNLDSSIHPDDFAQGEQSVPSSQVVDDQVGPDGRAL